MSAASSPRCVDCIEPAPGGISVGLEDGRTASLCSRCMGHYAGPDAAAGHLRRWLARQSERESVIARAEGGRR